jgi:hypothetical protein
VEGLDFVPVFLHLHPVGLISVCFWAQLGFEAEMAEIKAAKMAADKTVVKSVKTEENQGKTGKAIRFRVDGTDVLLLALPHQGTIYSNW